MCRFFNWFIYWVLFFFCCSLFLYVFIRGPEFPKYVAEEIHEVFFNPFQPSVPFHIEMVIWFALQVWNAAFYVKCNGRLKWVKHFLCDILFIWYTLWEIQWWRSGEWGCTFVSYPNWSWGSQIINEKTPPLSLPSLELEISKFFCSTFPKIKRWEDFYRIPFRLQKVESKAIFFYLSAICFYLIVLNLDAFDPT